MLHSHISPLRLLFFAAGLILAGCSTPPVVQESDGLRHTPPTTLDLADIPDATPRLEPFSRYGNPDRYVVFGKEYRTLEDFRGYRQRGIASWYGSKFHGLRTSSGEAYDMFAMTAAHKTLPLPCYARITNLRNGRSVVVKINDRGPFHDNRLIDLSYTAAWKLGIIGAGTGLVEVETIDPAAVPPEPEVRLASVEPRPAPAPELSVPFEPPPSTALEPSPLTEVVQKKLESPGLFLQVGAFGNADNARRLKSRLETELKTGVMVEQHQLADTPIYRVQVGPIASIELCDHLTARLNDMGLPGARLVVR
jgi:rare lipoprotein A